MKYSITPKSKDLHLYHGHKEFFTWINQLNYNYKTYLALAQLWPVKVDISPEVSYGSSGVYLNKNQTYIVAIYAIPRFYNYDHHTTIPNEKFEGNIITSFDGGCLYLDSKRREEISTKSVADFYAMNLSTWRVLTKNQYDARVFYESLVKEGLRPCF